MNRLLISTFIALSTVLTVANAEPKKAPKAAKVQVDPNFEFNLEIMNDEFYQKTYGEAVKKGNRKFSQSVMDVPAIEATFSEDFMQLRAELIGGKLSAQGRQDAVGGVKTPEELETLIKKYSDSANYNALSPQAKMVAIQLKALAPYKSFFYRAQAYFGKGTAIRSMIVTLLRNSSTAIQTFFPVNGTVATNQWEVVFDYMTQPMSGMGPAISTDEDLHNFVLQIISANAQLINEMVAIYKSTDQIWWDNKLYMSFANFTSEKDRYIKLGKPEMETILAGTLSGYSGLTATAAYSFTGLSDSIRETGKFFGIEETRNILTSDRNDKVMGLKASKRFETLRKFPQLFVLLPNGEKMMAASYNSLVGSVRYAKIAWQGMKALEGKDRQDFLFDPRAVLPFNRIAGTNFDTVEALISDKGARSTMIQGELVKVNISEFYKNPPRALSSLYPVAFKGGSETLPKTVDGKALTFRNYKQGSPVAWSANAYKKYFPELKKSSCPTDIVGMVEECTTDVSAYARNLSQTWGGAGFGAIISGMVF